MQIKDRLKKKTGKAISQYISLIKPKLIIKNVICLGARTMIQLLKNFHQSKYFLIVL